MYYILHTDPDNYIYHKTNLVFNAIYKCCHYNIFILHKFNTVCYLICEKLVESVPSGKSHDNKKPMFIVI